MAKGSHATYGGWESRVCFACGQRIVKSGPNARGAMYQRGLESDHPRSRHADCKRGPGLEPGGRHSRLSLPARAHLEHG